MMTLRSQLSDKAQHLTLAALIAVATGGAVAITYDAGSPAEQPVTYDTAEQAARQWGLDKFGYERWTNGRDTAHLGVYVGAGNGPCPTDYGRCTPKYVTYNSSGPEAYDVYVVQRGDDRWSVEGYDQTERNRP